MKVMVVLAVVSGSVQDSVVIQTLLHVNADPGSVWVVITTKKIKAQLAERFKAADCKLAFHR